jgi:hypothetical protein
MSENWLDKLNRNPFPALLEWDDEALRFSVRRDLTGENSTAVEKLWEQPEPVNLTNKQLDNGAWKYPGKSYDPESGTNYFLLETYRNFRVLVEMYGFHREHPAIQIAVEYIFGCQTKEGDIRGILGNQYMPYYHGAILELLIKAGFEDDSRVLKGLDWLLSMRQNDGGWLVPAQLVPAEKKTGEFWLGDPLPPDQTKPHAHIATGMAIRAFAAHPDYQKRPEIITASERLKNRFFQPDKYNDRKASSYWLKFQFPFWWGNLLTALDSLAKMGFKKEDEEIAKGLAWFIVNQEKDGLWSTGYGSGKNSEPNRRWVGLAICRVLKQYFA